MFCGLSLGAGAAAALVPDGAVMNPYWLGPGFWCTGLTDGPRNRGDRSGGDRWATSEGAFACINLLAFCDRRAGGHLWRSQTPKLWPSFHSTDASMTTRPAGPLVVVSMYWTVRHGPTMLPRMPLAVVTALAVSFHSRMSAVGGTTSWL